MSSQYRKIEFETEGAYGETEKEWLYLHHHNTVDILNVYDQRGNHLFSCSDGGFDLGEALKVVFTDWKDERLVTVGWKEFDEIRNLQSKDNKIGTIDENGNEIVGVGTHKFYNRRKRIRLVEPWGSVPAGSLGWKYTEGPMGINTRITLDDKPDAKSIRGAYWTFSEKEKEDE